MHYIRSVNSFGKNINLVQSEECANFESCFASSFSQKTLLEKVLPILIWTSILMIKFQSNVYNQCHTNYKCFD